MPNESGQDKTDEELVILTLENKEYFGYLIDRYEEKLSRYIRRISYYNDDDSKDLLQDIFIKAYTNLNGFDKRLSFSSWIYRIAHNHVVSSFRKRKARPEGYRAEMTDEILNTVAADLDIEGDLNRAYLKEHLHTVFDKLDTKYRDVLVLRFFENKDYAALSDILQKPPGTVATLLNRAKMKCKKLLESEFALQHHDG